MRRWMTALSPRSRRRLRWGGAALASGLLVVACLAARSGSASSWRNPLARWLPDLFPPEVTVCYFAPGFYSTAPTAVNPAGQNAAKRPVAKQAIAATSAGQVAVQNPLSPWLPGLFPGRMSCSSGLKQLNLALHAYADETAEPSLPAPQLPDSPSNADHNSTPEY